MQNLLVHPTSVYFWYLRPFLTQLAVAVREFISDLQPTTRIDGTRLLTPSIHSYRAESALHTERELRTLKNRIGYTGAYLDREEIQVPLVRRDLQYCRGAGRTQQASTPESLQTIPLVLAEEEGRQAETRIVSLAS